MASGTVPAAAAAVVGTAASSLQSVPAAPRLNAAVRAPPLAVSLSRLSRRCAHPAWRQPPPLRSRACRGAGKGECALGDGTFGDVERQGHASRAENWAAAGTGWPHAHFQELLNQVID